MPINRDLNVDPYFDDFDLEKQFYRVLFKPSYAVQARELTQLQTILQNQIEQFGDNIFKEGSIVKGCNFTELNDLKYVKVSDKTGFDVTQYVGFEDTVEIGGQVFSRDNTFELRGDSSGVRATVIAATRGFETRNPDLNTFYINYTTTSSGNKIFQAGELLRIFRISTVQSGTSGTTVSVQETEVDTINVTTFSGAVGNSFGLRSAPGIIFQKGHFLYAEEQLTIVAKYTSVPDNVSVGYVVEERIINAFQDSSLYDNANGSLNQNAPGADRLKLIPVLTAIPTATADIDTTFFALVRYSNGSAITLRDVSQYNVLGEEMARRTYEESGDYIVRDFKSKVIRRNGALTASVGTGLAYVKGYRVENSAEVFLTIDEVANTSIDERTNQAVSFSYGNYLDIIDTTASGTVPLGTFATVNLRDGSSSNLGTARVRNITTDKIFLFDIRLNVGRITDVEEIVGTSGVISVANNSIIKEAGLGTMVFDTGMISLKTTSDVSIPVRATKSLTGLSNTTVVLTPDPGEDFNLQNNDILFVDGTNTKIDVVSTTLDGEDLVITLDQTPSSTATIYYNKRITDADPFTKSSEELYVKCTFANTDVSSSSKFNLGFPDVYEIVSIIDADSNDVTGSFKLKTNQRDNFYDHSYIEFIPGRPAPAAGLMTVRMKAFKLNDTTGSYYFTVNSYPPEVPANKIPQFASASGRTYNLRDCLDFRPHVQPLSPATYVNAALEGTAPTVSDSSTGVNVAPTFSSSYEILTPSLDQFAQLDYEFYLNRTDSITINSYGNISLVKGAETSLSYPPNITGDQIKIADIFVPGVPALTPEEANAQSRQQYSVKITPRGTKSYRMRDIESIEKKVDNLRYYVLLSALEAETKNLNILDENGLTRFKNGIIVDPFNDLSIANLDDPDYNAAVDFTEKSLMPAVKTYPLNLKLKTSSGASIFPSTLNAKVATLQRNNDVSIISQPYATEFRNCVSNFYNYKGTGTLVPEYDTVYDTVTNPVTIDIDLVTPFTEFAEAIQEFIPLTSTSSELLSSTVIDPGRAGRTGFLGIFGRRRAVAPTIEDTFLDTTRFVQVTGEQVNEQPVGDFVTNFTFNPYMRSREVKIYMTGLRPNTQHYFFFDEVDVNQHVIPGTPVDIPDNIQRNGNAGDAISSDTNGVIRAVFVLPEATFFVGDRNLEVVDVDTYNAIDSGATSYGLATYRAYNFSVEKASLTVATRTPERFVEEVTSERTVTRRGAARGGKDPIAQTFFIKNGMGLGSNTVFVSKLDLFFKRKSTVNGVTVEIREVINGYPSYTVVPFSKVHLTPAQVSISDNASIATTINFPAPVRLDTEKEYAFAVIPDASDPEYLIFTSKVGGVDLTPGETQGLAIVQDWGDGVLFTSTNGSAWQSYQDEDIKFNLYRHNFNVSAGSVTLTNDDHEFITIENSFGRFTPGETAYVIKSRDGSTANTVSIVSGNNQITGTNLSATYAAGDYILVDNASTNKQILQVQSSNTSVIIADRPASFTGTINAVPIVLGTLVHYDFRYPDFIILEGSSANSTRKFAAADVIYGFDSEVSATITSVDNKGFSYIQPMISRTNDSVTNTLLSGTFIDPANPSTPYTQGMLFNDKTTFGRAGMVVYSKSNDTDRTKGMNLTVSMTNGGNVTSTPFVDVETAMVMAYEWKITNSSETTSKYISKTVELAESLDAEDLQVYVTGYRPSGTDIKVFIKPQAAEDPTTFDTNDWIELELTEGVNVFSSISNQSDFREYVYRVSDTDKTFGVLTYSNDISTFEGYRRFAIKIELHSDSIYKAPRLLDYRGIALT
jgi:uncharacterized alkaline shock family protein YloU